ncbi:MAG: hypothetical protein HQL16_02140 [Candidatus Omnitrophica bacterium]|nr:hypothetical protein [Candidatus Omnitrophota bacterium]
MSWNFQRKCILGALILCGVLVRPGVSFALTEIPFAGMVDIKKERLTLRFGRDTRTLALDVQTLARNKYHLTLDVGHVLTPFFDLAALIEGDFESVGVSKRDRAVSGHITSKYTFVNNKPVQDLNLKFAVRDRKFIIDSFLAGAFSGRGEIALWGEHRASLFFELLSADLEDVERMVLSDQKRGFDLSGVITGAVALSGPLAKPEIKGHFSSYNGRIKTLNYDSIILQFEGTYPMIRLNDSLVTQAEGFTFKVAGPIDLSDMPKLAMQIRQLKKSPIVTADKNKREWVFKRLSSEKDSVTEMKYFFTKDDRGDTQGVLGMEKRFDF